MWWTFGNKTTLASWTEVVLIGNLNSKTYKYIDIGCFRIDNRRPASLSISIRQENDFYLTHMKSWFIPRGFFCTLYFKTILCLFGCTSTVKP